jgi:hypothetical protein
LKRSIVYNQDGIAGWTDSKTVDEITEKTNYYGLTDRLGAATTALGVENLLRYSDIRIRLSYAQKMMNGALVWNEFKKAVARRIGQYQ